MSESYAKKLGLFTDNMSYGKLTGYVNKGAQIKTTRISNEFTLNDYQQKYNGHLLPLCAIEPKGRVHMYTTTSNITPKADWRIVSLIKHSATKA